MQLSNKYNSESIEDKWYQHWLAKGYFYSTPDDRKPYTIVIPPPNVTGILHMGHMLNNTIQDVLIRRARMQGYNACWVPGTDHASIATEAKVVQRLRKQGIKKSDLSRDEFMKHAWEWKEEHGDIILEQLKKLGASCDWNRTRFTMDENYHKQVIKVFVDLFNKGFIFRGLRMINWDPAAKTALSNEEVIYKEEQSKLYHILYRIKGPEYKFITIATTRPETMLGDTAIAVNPNDERYKDLVGKTAILPIIGRHIPIIADEYVEMEFGTGALKVTPAHDPNDYELGKKHNLEVVDVINDDGTMSEAAQRYVGEDRLYVRAEIVGELFFKGHIANIEIFTNKVGHSERTDAIVEPKLSLQWFLDMKKLAAPALENVMNDKIKLYPAKFKNTYRHWMENIREWCLSRQLWWGQRIPAYFYGEGEDDFVVANTDEEALSLAKEKSGKANLTANDLKQDEDVLDTWASSWIWPIAVFDGLLDEADKTDIDYYYPTKVLVTAPEILFFWVARMVMSGYEYKGDLPFDDVYLTGIVRDKKRRKMSKSLGNSPDALKMIADYGADAVRVGMLLASPAGNDLLFDIKLVEQGWGFCNKIWNALKLVKMWEVKEGTNDANVTAIHWFENRLHQAINEVDQSLESYRLSESLMTCYTLVWDDFCSWYLEMIKPEYGEAIDQYTYEKTIMYYEVICRLIHPFMPFISEEIYHVLKENRADDVCVAQWPEPLEIDTQIIEQGANAKTLISKIREVRAKVNLPKRDRITAYMKAANFGQLKAFKAIVEKLGGLEQLTTTTEDLKGMASFVADNHTFFVDTGVEIDVEAARKKLTTELDYTKGFMSSVNKKLSNERFVNNAPDTVIAAERKKLADAEAKIQLLGEQLAQLG